MIKNRIPIPNTNLFYFNFFLYFIIGRKFILSKSAIIFANSIDIFEVVDNKCNIPKYLSL